MKDSSARRVLVIDVGGTNVKVLATGQKEPRRYASGPTMTPRRMVRVVKKLVRDWKFDCVSLGFPGPIINECPLREPHNLGSGWIGFDFRKAFGCPVRIINASRNCGKKRTSEGLPLRGESDETSISRTPSVRRCHRIHAMAGLAISCFAFVCRRYVVWIGRSSAFPWTSNTSGM